MANESFRALRPVRTGRLTALAIICYVDLLFFPYFQKIIIPFSLPIALMGLLACRRITFPPQWTNILMLVGLFMVVSVTASLFLPQSSPYLIENIKRMLQFFTSFFYFMLFYHVARHSRIEKILVIISVLFLVYFASWLIFFIYDPLAVNSLLASLYGRLVTSSDVVAMHTRFAYFFTDPNTAGYFLLIAVLPWLLVVRSYIFKVSIIATCAVAVIFLGSRGALLALILAVGLWANPLRAIFRAIFLRFTERDFKEVLKFVFVAIIVGVVFATTLPRIFSDLPVFVRVIERVSNVEAFQTGGSRFAIWTAYAGSLMPLPIGRGYMFDTIYGGRFFPHSDFLRMVYSYGFIVAVLFVAWILRLGCRYPLLVVPALMAFGINSLIDEQKLFAVFLATLGVFVGMQQRYFDLKSRSGTSKITINVSCTNK